MMTVIMIDKQWQNFKPSLKNGCITSLIVLLTACVSTPSIKNSLSPASRTLNKLHLEHIADIQQFALQGRIGVQADYKSFSGSLSWQHDDHDDVVALFSPLGNQVANIIKTEDGITLEDANGKIVSAGNAETLTQDTLGWQLPLAGLSDWSLGRPTNSVIQDSTWDEQGLLTTLNQDNWKIEYQNYAIQNGYWLPTKILLKSEKVNLKLLVEQWLPHKN